MTTYRVIASTETAPNAPVTSTLLVALNDNVAATMEQQANAAKFALKSEVGSGSTDVDFNGLGTFSGVWFKLEANNTAGAVRNVLFDATVDGGLNYLGAVTLRSVTNTSTASLTGFFDFATGLVHGVFYERGNGIVTGTFSQTVAGASLSINGVRFDTNNSGLALAVMIHPNGGESAT